MKKKNDIKKEPMKIPKSAQQSIPYKECYETGVFQEADGLFSKTYRFKDMSFKNLAKEKQEAIYSQYQEFLNSLPPNEELEFNFINFPEDAAEKLKKITPAPAGDFLDDLRTELTEIIGDKLRVARNSITTEKFFTYSIRSKSVDEAMKRFLDVDEEMVKGFGGITKEKVEPITTEERLEVLHKVMNGHNESPYFEHDEKGKTSIDWKRIRKLGLSTKDLIAAPMKFNTQTFIMGERYGQVLFLDGIATWLNSNFLSELTETSFESCIGMRIIPIPQDEATKIIKNKNINITADVIEAQKRALKNGYSPDFIPMDLKNAKEQIDLMQEDMATRDQRMFFFSMVYVHFADSAETLKDQKETIRNISSKYMCSLKPLSMQQERGFWAALPLGTYKISTNRLLPTESLGVFIPFNEVACFEEGGHVYGTNPVNKTLIVHNRLSGINYNGLVLGSPGSGKSMSSKFEIVQTLLKDPNACICVIDPEGEYGPLAELFKEQAEVIKIAPGNGVYLNPMDLDIDTSHDSDGDPISMKIDFVSGLLETMLGHKAQLSPVQKSIVNRCIIRIYADYLATLQTLPVGPNGKKPTIDRTICPTLQNLFNMLLEQREPEAQNLAVVLEQYATGTFNTFAHQTNVNVDARFIVYNIKDIGTQLRDLALKVCLSDIWNKMIANRSRGRWTWAYVDEFHLLLGNPSSAEFLQSIWKRARKWWGVPTGITQNVEDLLLSPAARSIINTSNFIQIFTQSAIDRANLAELLELSESDLRYITNAESGSGLIYTGKQTIPFKNPLPLNTKIGKAMSTKAGEK